MIIDFEHGDSPSEYTADLCIIGSGPVGLTLASEFLNDSQIKVIVVESGGLKMDPRYQLLNEVRNTGDAASGFEGSRATIFGGTSTLWGGQAIPLSRLDFEERPWVANSGWPIKSTELTGHYERAAKLLRIDGTNFDLDIWKKNSKFKEDIDQKKVLLTFSRWSPAPDFSKKYLKKLSASRQITTVVNARVAQLNLREDGTAVDSAVIRTISGRTGRVHASIFVLCCGGIENARVLLCSTKHSGSGIGNQHGNVGRYFQDHVGYYGARLHPEEFGRFVDLFSSYFKKEQMYLPKLQLSEHQQAQLKTLSVVGNVGVEYTKDSTLALKRLFNDLRSRSIDIDTLRYARQVASDPVESLKLVFSYSVSKRMYYPKGADYFLIASCETEPHRQSSVSLDSESDALGMPKARINWAIPESVKHSLRIYYEHVDAELKRLKIARSVIKPLLYEENDDWKGGVFSMHHHIGTTRMSARAESGVVDPACRVHGVQNLYVGGSSVFPTSGSANPTFTAIALAMRLADRAKSELLDLKREIFLTCDPERDIEHEKIKS